MAPIVPAAPINGSDGFYCELYQYQRGPLTDFDTVETVELGNSYPLVVASMYQALLREIDNVR